MVVVMPAYNAAKTLKLTYEDLPREGLHAIILVDDGSQDDTIAIAKSLGLSVFVHTRNYGYGANQKTCYTEALRAGAEVVVMVNPDYQYDPRLLPEMIRPIQESRTDVVFGSRMLGQNAFRQGMPWWKYLANRGLTRLENQVFGLSLSDFHTGYRAYSRKVLDHVNLYANSDGFIFDQEIVAQIVEGGFRFAETSVPVRYFPEASSASFLASCRYGLGILWLLVRFQLHRRGWWRSVQFAQQPARYRRA